MASINRTKEIWHIPKRGNVHQTIYMVHVLTWRKFLNKTWTPGKQEAMASEMGKAGLTNSGGAISHQSVRTLLANIPKYLGFIYIDDTTTPSRIIVTPVGYQLLENHDIENVPHHNNLKDYQDSGDLIISSDIFNQQMAKLIITNPSIRNDCQNILVFPFKMTLKLLLEVEYLDVEELAYILFHTKSEDEYETVLERIRNFRELPPLNRQSEIDAYRRTEEGNLTLVQAPTSGYYIYLCTSTGLCERFTVSVNKVTNMRLGAIRLINVDNAKETLDKYKDAVVYDFGNNNYLWNEYFSNPNRIYPPFDIKIFTVSKSQILVTIEKNNVLVGSEVLSSESEPLYVPVFNDETYKISAYTLETGERKYHQEIVFSRDEECFVIDNDFNENVIEITVQEIKNKIDQLLGNSYSGFDEEYYRQLSVLNNVLSLNFIDNRRKGGRLEYLFYKLLDKLKANNIVDEVFWFGKKARYGICEPAPGGREGNPDIVFEIDDYLFVLELTTIRGTRAQWNSSEASSVPDHIKKHKENNSTKNVIGIFSAPNIHHQLATNLRLNARQDNVPMLFIPISEFVELLINSTKESLLEFFVTLSNTQLE